MDQLTKVFLSINSHIILYADDILLYKPISSREDLLSLQIDIDPADL